MNCFRQSRAFLGATLLFAACMHQGFADRKTQDAQALIDYVRKVLDLRASGSPPFSLTAHFRFLDPDINEREGTYLETWVSPQLWRREISAGRYHPVEVVNGEKRWIKPKINSESAYLESVIHLLALNDYGHEPVKIKKTKEENNANPKTRCIETQTGDEKDETFCFDAASNAPLSVMQRTKSMQSEFSTYAGIGGQSYPRKLRVIREGKPYLEIEIAEMKTIARPDESFFWPPEDSQEMPFCDRPTPPKSMHMADPEFPSGQATDGSAVLTLVVGVDGKPSDLRITKSAGQAFDQAALKAVNKWTFAPATCDGKPIPFVISVDTKFHR